MNRHDAKRKAKRKDAKAQRRKEEKKRNTEARRLRGTEQRIQVKDRIMIKWVYDNRVL